MHIATDSLCRDWHIGHKLRMPPWESCSFGREETESQAEQRSHRRLDGQRVQWPLELHVLLNTSWFDSRVSHGDSIFSVFCGGLVAFSLLLRFLGYSAGVVFLLNSHDFLDPERLYFILFFLFCLVLSLNSALANLQQHF